MHKFVALNSKITEISKARVQAVSAAVFYGKSIFTTIAVYNSKPFLWEKHWCRLRENAEILAINLKPESESKIYQTLNKLITKNKIQNARARITIFEEAPDKIWNYETNKNISTLITTANFNSVAPKISLTFSPFPVNSASPLAGVKSGNYFENIMAIRTAQRAGFDEAVRLNEKDQIVSACMANIFWIKKGKIFTASLKTGILKGITRGFILENFQVEEVAENIEVLQNADEIFLTSSGIGINPVSKFEEKFLAVSESQKIHKSFKKLIQNSLINV